MMPSGARSLARSLARRPDTHINSYRQFALKGRIAVATIHWEKIENGAGSWEGQTFFGPDTVKKIRYQRMQPAGTAKPHSTPHLEGGYDLGQKTINDVSVHNSGPFCTWHQEEYFH